MYNLPSSVFNKLKVWGGLDDVAGKSEADELNSRLLTRNFPV